MSTKGKTRRAYSPVSQLFVADNTTSSSESNPTASKGELVILPGGVIGPNGTTSAPAGGLAPSELLELSRRCFSCCNIVLQQEASIFGEERKMLLQQPSFAQHQLMKVVTNRISEQWYTDMDAFVADFTKLVQSCVTLSHDRHDVLAALDDHVAKMNEADSRRSVKATFQGFPQPLLEEMMAHAGGLRKKSGMPTATVDGGVEVGRYFARAYGLGLAKGARFCGEESREKAFYAARKNREAEYKTAVANRAALAAIEAVKRKEEQDKETARRKKKQKSQPVPSTLTIQSPSPVQAKRKLSQRTSRRGPGLEGVIEDGATEDASLEDVASQDTSFDGASGQPTALDVPSNEANTVSSNENRPMGPRRVNPRSVNHCHHLQGRNVELDESECELRGHKGTLRGDMIECLCGCGRSFSGESWVEHVGGKAQHIQHDHPFTCLRLADTKESFYVHRKNCDTSEQLCDTCSSWESPEAPMTSCQECHTLVHASEECASRAPAHMKVCANQPPSSPMGAPHVNGEEFISTVQEGFPVADIRHPSPILAWRGPPVGETAAVEVPGSPGGSGRSRPSRRRDSSNVHGVPGSPIGGGMRVGNGILSVIAAVSCGGSGAVNNGGETGVKSKLSEGEGTVAWVCRVCMASRQGNPR